VKALAAFAFALSLGSLCPQLRGQAEPAQPQANPSAAATPAANADAAPAGNPVKPGKPVEANGLHAQRKAAKLYLQGVKLLQKQQPEAAWKLLKQAAALQPENITYVNAAELARQSTVTQLVEQSSRAKAAAGQDIKSEEAALLLQRAQAIDPTNPLVVEHLDQAAQQATAFRVGGTSSTTALNQQTGPSSNLDTLSDGPISLLPNRDKHSFHIRTGARQAVEQVFRAYGIEASIHESVISQQVRLDIDDATFAQASHVVGMLTQSFYEPLDPHRVVVAKDSRENRALFQRLQLETIYLPGLNEKEITEVSNVARNVFGAQQAQGEPAAGTLTLRAPAQSMAAFNATMAELEDGKSEVDLNVKVIQLAHITGSETGTTFFQQTSVYNVFSEINSVLSQNQSLVQQIIASGLVPNANTLTNQLTILAILVSSGQLTGTPFNQGFLPFGGGLTQSIASPGPATLTMSLNSSDTRMLDDIHLQVADQEDATFKIGQRYPIETSSFSSAALPAISGITTSALSAATQNVPQVEYQDIGLTLKATPKVMRSNDVAITMDLKITALGGSSLNDIPILNSQQVTGVLTLRAGETAVLVSDLSRTQSRALSGLPGVGDIPGFEDISDIQKNTNVARLLILVTPRVLRNSQQLGHGPMLMVDKGAGGHPGGP
jgi:general secretion pathway protein D